MNTLKINILISFSFLGLALTAQNQNVAKTNFRAINGDEMLQKVKTLNLGSWSTDLSNNTRTYRVTDSELFNSFGYDGVGSIGNDTLFLTSDILGIQFLMIQALHNKTMEWTDNQKQQVQTLTNLQNNESENAKARLQVETLTQKISELEGIIFDLRAKIDQMEKYNMGE